MALDLERKDSKGNPWLTFPDVYVGYDMVVNRAQLEDDLRCAHYDEQHIDFIDNLLLTEAKREDDRNAMVADMMRRGKKWTIWDAVCEISAYYPELRAEDVPEIICRLNEAKLIIV